MHQEPSSPGWDALDHHYGPADDIPAMLTACGDPDPGSARRAFFELHNKIYHQGGAVVSAAPPVLPVLLGWAADPAGGLRGEALELIGSLAQVGRRARPRFVTPAWPAAWDGAVPVLIELLDDRDPRVRRGVGFPLAQAVRAASRVLPALRRRWQVEEDEAARIGLVATAGQLLRHLDGEWPAESVDWLQSLTRHHQPSQRLAGAVALRRSGLGGRDARHIDVIAEALGRSDVGPWSDAWCGPRRPERLAQEVDAALGDDRGGRVRLTTALLARAGGPALGGLRTAGEAMGRWRSPVDELLPRVADRLTDPEPQPRALAAELLAACGSRSAPWADRLAELARGPEPAVALGALHALSRTGDPRVVVPLAERLAAGAPAADFALRSGLLSFGCAPSLSTLVEPLHAHADVLLPLLSARLRAARTAEERRDLALLLAAWGPAAGPATGDLLRLIGTEAEPWALDALVAVGTAQAREAVRAAGPDGHPDAGPAERQRAAVRYWRATGDPEPLLAALGQEPVALLPGLVAELGPLARGLEPRLRERRGPRERDWAQVDLAHALWRITGTVEDAHATVLAVRFALSEDTGLGRHAERAIARIGEIGPDAAAAAPLLRPLLTVDRRPVFGSGPSVIADDDRLCATVERTLALIGQAEPSG